jgi:hypothetical protein
VGGQDRLDRSRLSSVPAVGCSIVRVLPFPVDPGSHRQGCYSWGSMTTATIATVTSSCTDLRVSSSAARAIVGRRVQRLRHQPPHRLAPPLAPL